MRLRALRIERLPGIEPGFALEPLDRRVNLVLGPNASGKTSLTRALEALLYPEATREAFVHVEASFEDAEGPLHATRLGRDTHWMRAGRPAPAPRLPPHRLRGCYVLHVRDLFATGEPEAAIQEHLARELAGGYDLEALAAHFRLKTTHGKSEARALQEAERERQRVHQQQRELRAQEARLDDLRAEQEAALHARGEAERCRQALRLLAARREREAHERRLAEFPPEMARLHGDEWARLSALREHANELERTREAAERARREAEARLAECGLADASLDDTTLAERRAQLQRLRALEQRIAALAEREREAAVRLEQAAAALGVRSHHRPVTPEAVRRAEAALAEKRKREARARALESELARLPERDAEPDPDALRRARDELSRWLATPAGAGSKWPIAGAVLMAVTGIAAIAVTALAAHIGLTLLLVPLLLGAWLVARGGGGRRREEARSRYRQSGLPPPAEWTEEAVRARLATLERELAEAEEKRARYRRRAELGGPLAAAREALEASVAALAELARSTGFDPKVLDADFHLWLRRIEAHDEACAQLGRIRKEREALAAEGASLGAELTALLAGHGEAPEVAAPDADSLEHRLRALEARLRHRQAAVRDRLEADRRLEDAQAALDRIARELENLFTAAGVSPGDEAGLRERLQALDAWRQTRDALRDARSIEHERSARLSGSTALLALVEAGDEAALERRAARCDEEARRYEPLTASIADINAALAAARRGRALEDARAKRQAAEEALRSRLDEALLAEAGARLVERVRREHEAATQPAILARAREWFARFTRHHFELLFEAGELGALDTQAGARRPLSELSSGTCTQLLIAVRLAFAEEVERGCEPLPLFLDEALTTSDPERFRAAVESLWLLAAERGRQIFYLTAQPGDVAFWAGAAGERPHVVDLAAVRRLGTAVTDPAALELRARPEPPSPEGRSPENYALALGVPPVDPWQDLATLHLFHLLRDRLALLHRLLAHGVERAGALRSLLASPSAPVLLSEPERAELAARLEVADTWQALWRRGRPRPVDRAALERSGAVSETFIERVAELAETLGGDGRSLVEALEAGRVSRFRASATEALSAWLEDHGHIDEREPLSDAELELRAIAAVRASEVGPCTPALARALVSALNAGVAAAKSRAPERRPALEPLDSAGR